MTTTAEFLGFWEPWVEPTIADEVDRTGAPASVARTELSQLGLLDTEVEFARGSFRLIPADGDGPPRDGEFDLLVGVPRPSDVHVLECRWSDTLAQPAHYLTVEQVEPDTLKIEWPGGARITYRRANAS